MLISIYNLLHLWRVKKVMWGNCIEKWNEGWNIVWLCFFHLAPCLLTIVWCYAAYSSILGTKERFTCETRVPYLWQKKRMSERGKYTSALGWKMDSHTWKKAESYYVELLNFICTKLCCLNYIYRHFSRRRQLGGLVPVLWLGVPPSYKADKL